MKGPSSKRQAPEKHQALSSNGCPVEWPSTMLESNRSRRFGCWNLDLLWSLELGAWCFSSLLAFLLLTAGCQRAQTTRSTDSRSSAQAVKTSTRRDETASRAAFRAAYPVFMPTIDRTNLVYRH